MSDPSPLPHPPTTAPLDPDSDGTQSFRESPNADPHATGQPPVLNAATPPNTATIDGEYTAPLNISGDPAPTVTLEHAPAGMAVDGATCTHVDDP